MVDTDAHVPSMILPTLHEGNVNFRKGTLQNVPGKNNKIIYLKPFVVAPVDTDLMLCIPIDKLVFKIREMKLFEHPVMATSETNNDTRQNVS